MQQKEEKILNYLNGFSDASGIEEIENWRKVSDENDYEFRKIEKLYSLTDLGTDLYAPNIDKAWDTLNSKLFEESTQVNKKEGKEVKMGFSIFYRVAAVLAIVLGLSYVYFDNQPEEMLSLMTSSGQTEMVVLADGSEVWVNENSTLSYPKDFDGEMRRVTLDGEAFFDVAKNKEKPFVIRANDASIMVLGTSFNVSTKDDYATVNVVSGKVALTENGGNHKVILVKGETGVYNQGELTEFETTNVNNMAWRTGKLVFKASKLVNVVTVLEQHYNTKVVLEGNIENCLVTSEFEKVELQEVLDVLSSIANLQYEKKNGTIYLTGPGC